MVKGRLPSRNGYTALRQFNHIHKKGPQSGNVV